MAVTRMGSATANLGSTGNVLNNAYLNKIYVSSLYKTLQATRLGVPSDPIQNPGSTTIRWQFMSVPSAATTELATEGGDPPNSTDFTTTPLAGVLREYAGFTDYSKKLMQVAISSLDEKFAEGLGYQAALTLDTLVLDATSGFASTTTSVDSGTALTADFVRQGVAKLVANEAKPHRDTPGFYPMIATTNAAYDLMGEGAPTWFQAKSDQYTAALTTPFKGTPATAGLYNCLIKTSNNIPTGSGNDINVLVADDSLGVAALDTNVMQPALIRTTPDQLVSAPVRNRGTIGWWVLFARILFDSNRVCQVLADT